MMTCKDCLHYEVCGGFTPTDLDADVFDYCRKGNTDEIPDIDERCGSFKPKADVVEVVRCKDCVHRNPNCYKCMRDNLWHDKYDFCSYGKRKGGAE